MKNVYVEKGFKNRNHYLCSLAEEFGLDEEAVLTLASIFGPAEDFDGLVSSLKDMVSE